MVINSALRCIAIVVSCSMFAVPQTLSSARDDGPTAAAIIDRAAKRLGGERYLRVTSQVGKGKYSILRDGVVTSFQSFTDVIVFPDKEWTEFKGSGRHLVQANAGDAGWIFDGDQDLVRVQNEMQIANFKRGVRTSLDTLLRGYWKGDGEITYVGRRQASLGKRNDVVKLTYKDGFSVEFEFAADDGLPSKAIYKRSNPDGEEIREEDRYAQFVEVNGVSVPFIVDRFTGGKQSSRINFETVEFGRAIPDALFVKPQSVKDAKKGVKY